MGDLEVLFALLFGAALLVRIADHARIPYPIVLVLGGLALAFVPGIGIEVEPEVILLVFVPPLLLSAGWYSSPRELRSESRALGLLALALVLVTTSVVAVAAHLLVDGFSWPAAFMLGAVIAPTDAVAAVATFSSVRVPDRVRRLVEGESLINDATGLAGFRVALGAATAGTFSLLDATVEFLVAGVGGALVGAVVAKFFLLAIRTSSAAPNSSAKRISRSPMRRGSLGSPPWHRHSRLRSTPPTTCSAPRAGRWSSSCTAISSAPTAPPRSRSSSACATVWTGACGSSSATCR
jgi:CPA1 family monovalent cation:H+ antiporter